MGKGEQAIRDLVRTWMSATRAGDSETVLSLMADDVVFMVPGQKPFGKAEFAATSQAMKGASGQKAAAQVARRTITLEFS